MTQNICRKIALIIKGIQDDQLVLFSGAICFYAIFALSPLLIVILEGLSYLANDSVIRQQFLIVIDQTIGFQISEDIQGYLRFTENLGSGRAVTSISVIILLIGSAGIFWHLQKALQFIWGDTEQKFSLLRYLWKRIKAVLAVLLSIVMVFFASILTTALTFIKHYSQENWFLSQVSITYDFLFSFSLVTLIMALSYYFLFPKRVSFRYFFTGSLFASILFSTGKYLLSLYIAKIGLASIYGAAGSLIILLIWIFYTCFVFLLGAVAIKVFHPHLVGNKDI